MKKESNPYPSTDKPPHPDCVDKQLLIKDLQKGMMIKATSDYILLIVDYVRVNPDHIVGISYAIGIDGTGRPHLLTNDSKLTLYKEKETIKRRRSVVCSICGKQMVIEEWMQANLHNGWSGCSDKFMIPHMNRSHPCTCGHLWLSTDALVTVGNILVWEYVP